MLKKYIIISILIGSLAQQTTPMTLINRIRNSHTWREAFLRLTPQEAQKRLTEELAKNKKILKVTSFLSTAIASVGAGIYLYWLWKHYQTETQYRSRINNARAGFNYFDPAEREYHVIHGAAREPVTNTSVHEVVYNEDGVRVFGQEALTICNMIHQATYDIVTDADTNKTYQIVRDEHNAIRYKIDPQVDRTVVMDAENRMRYRIVRETTEDIARDSQGNVIYRDARDAQGNIIPDRGATLVALPHNQAEILRTLRYKLQQAAQKMNADAAAAGVAQEERFPRTVNMKNMPTKDIFNFLGISKQAKADALREHNNIPVYQQNRQNEFNQLRRHYTPRYLVPVGLSLLILWAVWFNQTVKIGQLKAMTLDHGII